MLVELVVSNTPTLRLILAAHKESFVKRLLTTILGAISCASNSISFVQFVNKRNGMADKNKISFFIFLKFKAVRNTRKNRE
jgi:hypothetical protein